MSDHDHNNTLEELSIISKETKEITPSSIDHLIDLYMKMDTSASYADASVAIEKLIKANIILPASPIDLDELARSYIAKNPEKYPIQKDIKSQDISLPESTSQIAICEDIAITEIKQETPAKGSDSDTKDQEIVNPVLTTTDILDKAALSDETSMSEQEFIMTLPKLSLKEHLDMEAMINRPMPGPRIIDSTLKDVNVLSIVVHMLDISNNHMALTWRQFHDHINYIYQDIHNKNLEVEGFYTSLDIKFVYVKSKKKLDTLSSLQRNKLNFISTYMHNLDFTYLGLKQRDITNLKHYVTQITKVIDYTIKSYPEINEMLLFPNQVIEAFNNLLGLLRPFIFNARYQFKYITPILVETNIAEKTYRFKKHDYFINTDYESLTSLQAEYILQKKKKPIKENKVPTTDKKKATNNKTDKIEKKLKPKKKR